MGMTITGRHQEIPAHIRSRIEELAERIGKYLHRLDRTSVICDLERKHHRVEISLHGDRTSFHSHAVDPDFMKSVDTAFDRMERQVEKHRERMTEHRVRRAEAGNRE